MIGKTISHYQILEKLGEGGMGEVYLVEDTKLDRKVALKFLPKEYTKDNEANERFQREAKAAAALNHPNIITIHEINEFEDQIYIAMEYVEGQTLKDLIIKNSKLKRNGRGEVASPFHITNNVGKETLPLHMDKIVDIAIQIGEGLQKAHETGIVHRDIKPQNILIDKDNRVKILDFGLAKLKGVSQLTQKQSTLGTLHYMSPEQVSSEGVDNRSDIWSLGVVLYEMLTGKLPFKGEYQQSIIYSIINEQPESITSLNTGIPEELERIVDQALAKNKETRYQNVDTLLKDLKDFKIPSIEKVQNIHISEKSENSIAVLPFVNMSTDPENEYFSDGLTEELINYLAQLKDLRVVARTSAFAFKGKELDIRDIGDKLNVTTILEGSVRKAGNRLRITAQLINVSDGYHIWSQRYDRDLKDVFDIQDEIAQEIATKLKTDFREKDTVYNIDTSPHMGAYEHYLRGRFYFNKFSPDWIDKAIDSFSKAIAIDQKFAPAYTGLADAYIFKSTPLGALASDIAWPKAKEAAETALRLNPNLSEAYVSLGAIATFYDWDREEANEYFKRAIELNPNNPNARLWYELMLSLLDQAFDEGKNHLTAALNLDPLNYLIRLRIGYIYYYKYDFDTVIDYFREMVQAEPGNAGAYHGLMDAYGQQGENDLAIKAGEKAVKLSNYAVPTVCLLGATVARAGNNQRAQELLSLMLKRRETEYVSPFWIGVIYLGMKDYNKMYEWFEKAFTQRDGNLLYLFVPPFDDIREDQRFIKLRQKMGLKK